MTKQIHLAAHFPGVNNTTVWSDPAAGSHIEFDSFRQFAQIAERGKFDFLFLAEGLRLREQNGLIYDLDVVGRPDTFTVLAALAAVTEHIGLTGTINSTFNEPYEVARQFASLDHLSGGRAAWNVVTSWDAFTGENFRRGGYLAQGDRYERARAFLATATELWDSWHGDELLADVGTGQFLATAEPGTFRHRDGFFDIAGQFNVPRSPQGRPVVSDTLISQGRGRSREPVRPGGRHRGHRPAVVHRLGADGRHDDQRAGPGRRGRRLHPGPAHHPRRTDPVRRPGRPAVAGARRVPCRLHRHHAARPPRPNPATPSGR